MHNAYIHIYISAFRHACIQSTFRHASIHISIHNSISNKCSSLHICMRTCIVYMHIHSFIHCAYVSAYIYLYTHACITLDLDPLPNDFVLHKRLWISWFPRLRFCGRCRNLEFTITMYMHTDTCRKLTRPPGYQAMHPVALIRWWDCHHSIRLSVQFIRV